MYLQWYDFKLTKQLWDAFCLTFIIRIIVFVVIRGKMGIENVMSSKEIPYLKCKQVSLNRKWGHISCISIMATAHNPRDVNWLKISIHLYFNLCYQCSVVSIMEIEKACALAFGLLRTGKRKRAKRQYWIHASFRERNVKEVLKHLPQRESTLYCISVLNL